METYWSNKGINDLTCHEIGENCPNCNEAVLENEENGNVAGCPSCGYGYPTSKGACEHSLPTQLRVL